MTAAVTAGPLTPGQVSAVLALTAAAREADGVAPLSEQTILHVRHGSRADGRDWLVTAADGAVAGFAHLDPSVPGDPALSGELVVHPAYRRHGHGTALAAALAGGAGTRDIRVWAHGDLPASAEFAKATGFTRVRELWQMLLRFSGTAALPGPALPGGVTLRTFVPGSDEEAWLAVNRRAFAHHPEQGGWTREDLDLRMAEPWFDPGGFFLAVRSQPTGPAQPPPADADQPATTTLPADAERLVGFHWTKVHPSGGTGGGPIGEVYVVGVDPEGQGGGLGKAITVAGLAHLRARGLAEVMLYVDGDNTPAVRLYQKLGFRPWHTDVMYERAKP